MSLRRIPLTASVRSSAVGYATLLSSGTTTKAGTTTGRSAASFGNWNTDAEFVPDERAMAEVVDNVAERGS
jgi:hypothetical protein